MKQLMVLFLLMAPLLANAQYYGNLTVNDPQQWWSSRQGDLEKADISIYPVDRYLAVNIYLNISAKTNKLNYTSTAQLEAVLNFSLPAEAFVTDLWLWVGDDIIRGKIYDVWTASAIYEDIVNRRKDPALLRKQSATSYELRVYPFKRDEYRRVKISYMVPADITDKNLQVRLPIEILRSSISSIPVSNILFWPNSRWNEPGVSGGSTLTGEAVQDGGGKGPVYRFYFYPGSHSGNDYYLTLPVAGDKKYFLTKYNKNQSEGFYQLTIFPGRLKEEIQKKRRFVFAVDYASGKSNITPSKLKDYLETTIRNYIATDDEFNIFFSGLSIKKASDKWVTGDTASVSALFKTLNESNISAYSSLPALLNESLKALEAPDSTEKVVILVSASDQFGTSALANGLVNDVLANRKSQQVISVLDINDRDITSYWINGNWYYGNEYLYQNLTIRTGGQYQYIRYANTTFDKGMYTVITGSGRPISNYELTPSITGGLSYQRFDVTNSTVLNSSIPITQVGKFTGSSITGFNYVGVSGSLVDYSTVSTPVETIENGDSLVELAWFGKYIRSLELMSQSNLVKQEIIRASAESRVLSQYTAFLALEPSDTVKPCIDCYDETGFTTGVSGEPESFELDSVLTAYPNPFNPTTTIHVKLPASLKGTSMKLGVYNLLGQEVYTYPVSNQFSGEFSFTWSAINNQGEAVPSGLYLVVLQADSRQFTRKITLLK